MRTIRVTPLRPNDPTFNTPEEAIAFRPIAAALVASDGEKLNHAIVERVDCDDQTAWLFLRKDDLGLRLTVDGTSDRLRWMVDPLPISEQAHREQSSKPSPIMLVWPGRQHVWDRIGLLSKFVGQRISGLSCTEDYLFVYADQGPAIAFSMCRQTDSGENLLFWWPEDA
jgi:hypothetical protein